MNADSFSGFLAGKKKKNGDEVVLPLYDLRCSENKEDVREKDCPTQTEGTSDPWDFTRGKKKKFYLY